MLKNTEMQCSKRLWNSRRREEHLPRQDYYSELRNWVEQSLLEAERNGNVKKAERFLEMLKEL